MKKTAAIFLFLISVTFCSAQEKKIENLPKFDHKRIHFGFTLAINNADFVVTHQPDFWRYDSLLSVQSEDQLGFNLGIVTDLHLHPYFNLRFIPSLAFAQRNLEYSFDRGDSATYLIVKPVESTFLEFPLYLKYRSKRVNNFAAYIIGGPKFSFDLASQKDVVNTPGTEIVVKLNDKDYSLDIGFGLDLFLEYFKFSPEIKMSFGLPNTLIKDNTIFSDPIQRLNSRIFLFSLHFEG